MTALFLFKTYLDVLRVEDYTHFNVCNLGSKLAIEGVRILIRRVAGASGMCEYTSTLK